ncbi:hypothetical protein [Streptomyces sp. NPDC015350]|uniref:hypothetical protein n=1 Tax=Streptomyces sp. NPDC015350 TaxID=3364955 RepID=UPI0036F8A3E9
MDPKNRPPSPAEQPVTAHSDADALIAAVNEALSPAPVVPTAHRDTTPLPLVGTAPPVAQPGRPPMSQRATDVSTVMLAGGAASLMTGGGVSLVLWRLADVDPLVLAVAGGAPVAALMALARVIGRARSAIEAAPATHHHHYDGPVHQDHTHVTNTARGVVARTHTDARTRD